MAKVGRQIHRLFLKLLNFTPELLAKTQRKPNFSTPALMSLSATQWKNTWKT